MLRISVKSRVNAMRGFGELMKMKKVVEHVVRKVSER